MSIASTGNESRERTKRRPAASLRHHRYRAFGLSILSSIRLPELAFADPGPADVTIRRGEISGLPPEARATGAAFLAGGQEAYFCWSQVGAVRVARGMEVTLDPAPDEDKQLTRVALLGTATGVLLHQRGPLVLHGSAVALDGQVVVFLGDKGWGKSTMAAVLCARGHQLVTDDLVVVDLDSARRAMVRPGFPHLKLWPDSVIASLGENPCDLPRLIPAAIAPSYDKRIRRITGGLATEPLPLRHIYVLSGGLGADPEPIPASDAVRQLIGHTYAARYGSQLLQGPSAGSHLRDCVSLIETVPVQRLGRPNSLDAYAPLAERIEAEVRCANSPACGEPASAGLPSRAG